VAQVTREPAAAGKISIVSTIILASEKNECRFANCDFRFEIINWKSGQILRAYPNNQIYCGQLQSTMPALSAKNVLNVASTTPPVIFGLPPWPRTFRSAS